MKTKRILSLLLALIFCLSLVPAASAEGESFSVELTGTYDQTSARSMLDMVNTLRREDARQLNEDEEWVDLGELEDLHYSYALEEIAMQRAVEIALSFSHTRPSGESCYSCLATDGTRTWGENIAAGYTTAAAAFEGWCETDEPYLYQGHRRNMLAGFQSIGIAHVVVNGTHYWVQEFSWDEVPGAACAAPDGDALRSVPVAASSVSSCSQASAEPAALSLQVGETAAFPRASASIQLTDAWPSRSTAVETTPAWQSADESVARAEGGTITAVGAGETTLSASVFGSQTLTVPVTVEAPAPALADGFYLIQPDWTVSAIDPAQRFEANGAAQGEYLLTTDLSAGEQLKVVKVVNGAINAWYPDGMNNEYTVDEAHAGHVTIYFRDAYYPDWASFGGYIYIGASITPEDFAEVYGASLSLKGLIRLSFYLFLPQELLDDVGAYVTLNGKKLPLATAPTREIDGRTAYQFSFNLSAKEMRKPVTLRLYDGQDQPAPLFRYGQDLTETGYSYSVQDYLDKVMADCDSLLLLNLARAMNDYGSLAQLYFDYDASNRSPLVTSPETVEPGDLENFAPVKEEAEDPGLRYVGSSLILKSGTVLRHYFTLESGSLDDYTVTLDGKEASLKKVGKYWVLELDNISAKDLDQFQLVRVARGGETVLSLKYCPLSYVCRVLNGGSDDETLQLLCKALFLYWQAAEEYFSHN